VLINFKSFEKGNVEEADGVDCKPVGLNRKGLINIYYNNNKLFPCPKTNASIQGKHFNIQISRRLFIGTIEDPRPI
jgi:hypothetical protein